MTYAQRPALQQWGVVARVLISKYNFLKDPPLILQCSTPPAEAMESQNNEPYIVLFADPDDDDCLLRQFFICVEQALMMECSSFIAAIFFCIAAHSIFNLSYHPKTGDVWLFVQEKILNVPSKAGVKRHPSSASHFSGICRTFESMNKEL